jgi:hypothetical protein
MLQRSPFLAPTLLLLASASVPVFALDNTVTTPASPTGQPQVIGPNGGTIEVNPGSPQNAGRVVYIQGLVDLDYLQLANYSGGNNSVPDHRDEEWIRAELGARVEVDDRVEVAISVAYQGVSGTNTPTAPAGTAANNDVTSNGPTNGMSGNAVVNDAYVKLKEFLGTRALTVEAGRMPVSWNLRKDHAAFLYDSNANDPTITSWDGLRAQYNYDTINFTPYAFRMPDDSSLFGVIVDWEPTGNAGSDRLFFTGSANLERNIVLNTNYGDTPDSVNPPNPVIGSKLYTYYVGVDADLSDFELFGEFAMERGQQDANTSFAGFGASGGIDWHLDTQVVAGLQLDFLSGDNNDNNSAQNPNTVNHSFINKWSGMSDTLIVENPKYGRLANLVEGNLEAFKAKLEYGLDEKKQIRLKLIYGYYRMEQAELGGDRGFGQEADLVLSWDYTTDATISLQGGGFKPGSGYDALALSNDPGRSLIYVIGANLLVKF